MQQDRVEACWEVTDDLPYETGQPLLDYHPSNAPEVRDCVDESEGGWSENPRSLARYYPTVVKLDGGRVLVAAGDYWIDCNGDMDMENNPNGTEVSLHRKWAIYDHDALPGNRWSWDNNVLTGSGGSFTNPWVAQAYRADSPYMVSYPRLRMLPYGLFYAGNDRSNVATAEPSYLWTPLSAWSLPDSPYLENPKNENRFTGTCVVLTMDATDPDISVLLIGGGANVEQPSNLPEGAVGAEIITYRRDPGTGLVSTVSPGWSTTSPMHSSMGRTDGNAVLLPDGTVLAVGGEEGPSEDDQNRDCEIFTPNPADPPAGTWSDAASLNHDRGHHSVALLLPDGRVFASGHENHVGMEGYWGKNYEIYYPPYLFEDADSWAERDTIVTWPDPEDLDPDTPLFVSHGLPFEITVKDGDASDIDEVVLMEPCAVTHALNFSQGRIRLSHSVVPGDPGRLVVSGPKDSTYAPEGYYLLFVLDENGGKSVPSEGRWVKVQAPDASQFVIPTGTSTLWGGDVWLTRDLKVEGTLTVLPGTTVHVEAGATSSTYAGGWALIDIAIEGAFSAAGAKFTTTNPGSEGDWGGLLFNLTGSYHSAYGYAGVGGASSISDSTIERAESAIRITNRIAPALEGVTFTDNTADILVDETDAVVPRYRDLGAQFVEEVTTWDLEAPVKIVATQSLSPVGDALYGTTGRTNVIVEGALITRNDVGQPTERVTFLPDGITDVGSPAAGNDWGGLFLGYGAEADIAWTDIAYASNPLFVLYPDGTSIRNTTIHHFASTGLWVYGSTGDGLLVEDTTIDRGEGLHTSLGTRGVFLDKATNVRFGTAGAGNTVVLDGVSNQSGGVGVEVSLGKTLCQASGPTETIEIASSTVVGPGVDPNPEGDWSGIRFHWVCGSATRTVGIESNWIGRFNFAGLDLSQAVDGRSRAIWFRRAAGRSRSAETRRPRGFRCACATTRSFRSTRMTRLRHLRTPPSSSSSVRVTARRTKVGTS